MVTHVFIKNGLMWLFSSSCRFRPNKQFHGAESVLDNAIVPQLCCINQQMHSIKYKKITVHDNYETPTHFGTTVSSSGSVHKVDKHKFAML